jgi:hypothetical protein
LRISDCRLAAVVITGAVALAGCAAPEQSLLEAFFGASRLRDTTALQSVSTVIFEPLEHGIVRTFQITRVTPEREDGPIVSKDVTVEAPVVLPDGQTVQKTLVVRMQRAKNGKAGVSPWIITAIADAGATATLDAPRRRAE